MSQQEKSPEQPLRWKVALHGVPVACLPAVVARLISERIYFFGTEDRGDWEFVTVTFSDYASLGFNLADRWSTWARRELHPECSCSTVGPLDDECPELAEIRPPAA